MPKRPKKARKRRARAVPILYIGQWIRRLGKKPIEIVKATGINEGYLSELINNKKTNPSAAVLRDIAKVLGIPSDCFDRPPPGKDLIEELSTLDPAVLARLRLTPLDS